MDCARACSRERESRSRCAVYTYDMRGNTCPNYGLYLQHVHTVALLERHRVVRRQASSCSPLVIYFFPLPLLFLVDGVLGFVVGADLVRGALTVVGRTDDLGVGTDMVVVLI